MLDMKSVCADRSLVWLVHPSQIKREVEAILAKMSAQGADVLKYSAVMRADSPGWRHTAADADGWRQVVSRGAWNELVLFGGGERIEANCVDAPATLRAIESVPGTTALARCDRLSLALSFPAPRHIAVPSSQTHRRSQQCRPSPQTSSR